MTLRMCSHRFKLGAATLVGALLLPAAAQAQSTAGWALDRYDPTPAGDVFFASEFPWYGGAGQSFAFRGGLTFDYARNPLVLRVDSMGQERVTRIVSDMAVLHAQFGVAFANRLNVHLSLPVGVYQAGERSVGGLAAADSAGLGDPRLGLRVRIFGESDKDAVSLHAGGQLYINSGIFGATRANNLTDEGFRGRLNFTLAGRGGPIRWSFGGGLHFRQTSVEIAGTRIGNDVFATAAIGVVALDDRLTIGPELWASTVLTNAFEERHVNVEGTLGAHYLIADTVQVGLGIGPGFTYGAGTPAWRALANVAYAPAERTPPPERADADQDGVYDDEDQCPTVPMGANPDPARRGCPLMDTDLDGVFDPDDQCVTEPQGANPDPARRGCPRGDRDGDTVFDDEDQCVDVPMGPNPDPARRGCPDGDDDNDQVLNGQDQCRTESRWPLPDTTRLGCPIRDSDCDTISDNDDACPMLSGVPSQQTGRRPDGTQGSLNGCPNRQIVLEGGIIRTREHINFAVDRDELRLDGTGPGQQTQRALDLVLDALRATGDRRVRIIGHTDADAPDDYNLDLSRRRAQRVRAWLLAHGIAESRMEFEGRGESQPLPVASLVPPMHPPGCASSRQCIKQENRRVEFELLESPLPPTSGPDAPPAQRPGASPMNYRCVCAAGATGATCAAPAR